MRLGAVLPSGDFLGASSQGYPAVAISPDGTRIAYIATHSGVSQLYLRDVGEWSGRLVPGTADAHTPFFSPDGKWIGAVVGSNLMKYPVAGGAGVVFASSPYHIYGVNWSADSWIYFGTETPLGLRKVQLSPSPPLGGVHLNFKVDRENDQRFPETLPGGQWVLFAVRYSDHRTFDQANIDAVSLRNGVRHQVLKGGTSPRYLPSGHLLFVRAGVLMAVPFDALTAQVKGTPVPVVEGIAENPRMGAGQYAVSSNGTLVYLAGGPAFADRELVSVDRNGVTKPLAARKLPYEDLAVSPDGKSLALTIDGPERGTWIHDIARDADTRFTSGAARYAPTWSNDGKHIFLGGFMNDGYSLFTKPADGSGAEEEIVDSEEFPPIPGFMAKDGRFMLYGISSPKGPHGLMRLFLAGKKIFPLPMNTSMYDASSGQISPDGAWIAYASTKSDQSADHSEIYIAKFPGLEGKTQVSTGGGRQPQWSADGKELYYLDVPSAENPRPLEHAVKLMAMPVQLGATVQAGAPHMLFDGPFYEGAHAYAITPDGKGFILIRETAPAAPQSDVKVILNFAEELKRRVPVH